MKRNYVVFLTTTLVVLLVVAYACKKDDEENSNNPPQAPAAASALWNYSTYFFAEWTGVENASGYKLDVATDMGFTNFVNGYNGKDVGNTAIAEVKGLDKTTKYYYRLRAYNSNGESANSNAIELTTAGLDTMPNMDFERWIQYPNFEDPAPHRAWATVNKLVDLNPNLYFATTLKTDDVQHGNYAAMMFSDSVPYLPILSGSVATGVFTVNLQKPLESLISGAPYRSKPTRFKGYFKYQPQQGDSCEIRTTLFKWNPDQQKRVKVGEAITRRTDTTNVYTHFDLPFTYFSQDEPDSIEVIFTSSAGGEYFIAKIGSTLYIDNVSFEFD